MRKLFIAFAVAGLIALSPKSEAWSPARPPAYLGPLPMVHQTVHQTPRGEVGLASWYGMDHQGNLTASGEQFDKNRLTAAHRSLPLGTTVRVTNLENLESTLLKINDRGPGITGRVIDLSWAAANELGFVETGLARVEIDVVSYPQCWDRQATSAHCPKVN